MGFFTKILDSLIKAAKPTFSFKDDSLFFKISGDEFYKYDLNKYDQKTRHDPYVLNAYTLKSEEIFLEYIKLPNNTSWNGSALGYFESLFKNELKIDKLEILEKYEINNYVFKTYQINEQFVCFFIYIYHTNNDIFIIDTKGELYKNILEKIKKDYTFKYEDSVKGLVNFDLSLVKKNTLEEYFSLD